MPKELSKVRSGIVNAEKLPYSDNADDDILKFDGSDIDYEEIFARTKHFKICNMNSLFDTSW